MVLPYFCLGKCAIVIAITIKSPILVPKYVYNLLLRYCLMFIYYILGNSPVRFVCQPCLSLRPRSRALVMEPIRLAIFVPALC